MTGIEFQVYQHLVVTRAAAVNLLSHIAQTAGEHQFHLRVHILHALFYLEAAFHGILVYGAQLTEQHLQLIGTEQSDAFEHSDMGHAAQHVVGSQIHVHLSVPAHGKPLYLLVYLKVLFPQFACHRLLFFVFFLHWLILHAGQHVGHLLYGIGKRLLHHAFHQRVEVGLDGEFHL